MDNANASMDNANASMDSDDYSFLSEIPAIGAAVKDLTLPFSPSMNFDDEHLKDEQKEILFRLVPNECKNKEYELGISIFKCPFTFGRHKSNIDQTFTEAEISGLHATITIATKATAEKSTAYAAILTDHSENGTFINNRRIGKGNDGKLFDTDIITFIQHSKCSTHEERPELSFIFYKKHPNSEDQTAEIYKKYDLRDKLGKGSFAVVKLGICRENGNRFAVKVIDRKKYENKSNLREHDSIDNEWKIMKEIDHKNVIRVHDIYDTEEKLYLVLDLAKGGELFHRIGIYCKLNEQICRYILSQLLDAVMYLHGKNIAHRDLKVLQTWPENILMVDERSWDIKITDFGLSRLLANEKEVLTTLCGTPMFVAPEVLNSGGYGFEVDYWSMGVILYVMLVGHPPYNEKDGTLLELVQSGRCSFPSESWKHVSESALDLVKKLLTKEPDLRIKGEEMFGHPWMRESDGQKQPKKIIGRKRARSKIRDLCDADVNVNVQPNKKQKLMDDRAASEVMSMEISPMPLDCAGLASSIDEISIKPLLNENMKKSGNAGGDYCSRPAKKQVSDTKNVNNNCVDAGAGASYIEMSDDDDDDDSLDLI